MKKALTTIWAISALFVMPCILNLESVGCMVFTVLNMAASVAVLRRVSPEYFN